jgi:hypothetical protein
MVNTVSPLPRPATILSTCSLCIGVSGHSGRDRSTSVWQTWAAPLMSSELADPVNICGVHKCSPALLFN